MPETTLESLEKRVAALEEGMGRWLQANAANGTWKDWRRAVGNFTPSELSEEVDAAGRAIREEDRRHVDQ
jgi:hypothetical protein